MDGGVFQPVDAHSLRPGARRNWHKSVTAICRRKKKCSAAMLSFLMTVTIEPEDIHSLKVDRTALSVGSIADDSGERAYWHGRTPRERLQQVEFLRRINYGYHTAPGLQRVLEITERQSLPSNAPNWRQPGGRFSPEPGRQSVFRCETRLLLIVRRLPGKSHRRRLTRLPWHR